MTMKPELAGSLFIVLGANLVVAVFRANRHGYRYRARGANPLSASVG